VLCYSGFYGLGIKEVWDMVYDYVDFVKKNGYFDFRRAEQAKYWMFESINEQLRNGFYNNETIRDLLPGAERNVLEGRQTSFIAAKQLLDTYYTLISR
jgi:LAO/AO transport system kinase